MKRKPFLLFLGSALLSLFLTVGCQPSNPPSNTATSNNAASAPPANLLISAAASTRDALEKIQPLYQKARPTVSLTYNFGASGALLQQIQQGAPADIFISAAERQMDTLEKAGDLVPGTRTIFAKNQLMLVVPTTSKLAIANFTDLRNPAVRRISLGEPRSVPAGEYAEQVLRKQNLWDELKPKFVFANNVRQVLAAVETANAEAGFVYTTDAKTTDRVKVVVMASESDHSPIILPMAVLKKSRNVDAAKEFVQFLSGPESKEVLRNFGFVVD